MSLVLGINRNFQVLSYCELVLQDIIYAFTWYLSKTNQLCSARKSSDQMICLYLVHPTRDKAWHLVFSAKDMWEWWRKWWYNWQRTKWYLVEVILLCDSKYCFNLQFECTAAMLQNDLKTTKYSLLFKNSGRI